MLGLEIEPCPPETASDLLGAIVATVLLGQGESEGALLLDSDLIVEGESLRSVVPAAARRRGIVGPARAPGPR